MRIRFNTFNISFSTVILAILFTSVITAFFTSTSIAAPPTDKNIISGITYDSSIATNHGFYYMRYTNDSSNKKCPIGSIIVRRNSGNAWLPEEKIYCASKKSNVDMRKIDRPVMVRDAKTGRLYIVFQKTSLIKQPSSSTVILWTDNGKSWKKSSFKTGFSLPRENLTALAHNKILWLSWEKATEYESNRSSFVLYAVSQKTGKRISGNLIPKKAQVSKVAGGIERNLQLLPENNNKINLIWNLDDGGGNNLGFSSLIKTGKWKIRTEKVKVKITKKQRIRKYKKCVKRAKKYSRARRAKRIKSCLKIKKTKTTVKKEKYSAPGYKAIPQKSSIFPFTGNFIINDYNASEVTPPGNYYGDLFAGDDGNYYYLTLQTDLMPTPKLHKYSLFKYIGGNEEFKEVAKYDIKALSSIGDPTVGYGVDKQGKFYLASIDMEAVNGGPLPPEDPEKTSVINSILENSCNVTLINSYGQSCSREIVPSEDKKIYSVNILNGNVVDSRTFHALPHSGDFLNGSTLVLWKLSNRSYFGLGANISSLPTDSPKLYTGFGQDGVLSTGELTSKEDLFLYDVGL